MCFDIECVEYVGEFNSDIISVNKCYFFGKFVDIEEIVVVDFEFGIRNFWGYMWVIVDGD